MSLGADPCVWMWGCMEATEGVSKPPEATDPKLQNTVNHVSVVVYCRGALCDQRHVTLLPSSVCFVCTCLYL